MHFVLHGTRGSNAEVQAVFTLEDRLTAAIDAAHVGEYDGNDIGGGTANLYAYGPNANALFRVMAPLLRTARFRPAYALLRFGAVDDPAARERRVSF